MDRQPQPTVAQWLAALAAAAGVIALTGWILDIETLKSVLPGLVAMKANTAICLALAGAALWRQAGREAGASGLSWTLAAVVTLLGGLTLGEHLFGWELGLDQLLFSESPDAVGTSSPGRMAFTTAWAFLAVGPALACVSGPRRWAPWVAQTLAVPVAALGLLACVGYVLEGPRLYSIGLWTAMALHTAVAFVALGLGALLARPTYLLPVLWADRGPAGMVSRVLLPLSVTAPVLSSWLWLRGQRAGLFDASLGLAVLAVVCAGAFAAGSAWLAVWLRAVEQRRQAAEQALHERDARYEATFEQAAVGIAQISPDGDWLRVNQRLCDILDYTREELMALRYGDITHPDDLDADLLGARQLLDGEIGTFSVEKRYLRRGGQPVWARLTVTLVRGGEGQPAYYVAVVEDISARRAAEDALRESERSLRELMLHARCSLWSGEVIALPGGETSQDMRDAYRWRVKAQPDESATQSMLPLKVTDGRPYTSWLHASLTDEERAAKDAVGLAALRAGADHYGQEFRCRDSDGREHWVHEEVTLRQVAPDRWQVFGVWLDVTERRGAMEALAAREREMRELMRHARCALWGGQAVLYPGDDGRLETGPIGWAIRPVPDEQSAQALVPLAVPADKTYIQFLHESVPPVEQALKARTGESAVRRGDSHYSQEFPCVDRHGFEHWIHEDVSLQPAGPDRYNVFGVWVDMTELHRALRAAATAERFSRATIDALSAHICVLDESGTILTVNQAWRDFALNNPPLGSNVSEGADYLAVCDAVEGPDATEAAAFAAGLRDVIAGRQIEFAMEYGCHSPEEQRWFIGRATRFAGDGPARAVVSHVNITDRVLAEEERARLEQQVRSQQRLEAVGTLAGGVAHEINNPIMGVTNYAQLILDSLPPDSEPAQFANEILRETGRVTTIVRNLLQFSRQEKQSHSPARMADIVDATLSLTTTLLKRDQVALRVMLPDDLPDIKCRSQQIQQVIMNLVTNARDALNERYPGHHPDKAIWISCRQFGRDERRWLRLTVEDHGAGIDPGISARLLDPFFTTKPRETGTGLGLSISHGIVNDHHGRLWYESEAGQWTRFHVELPVDNGWDL